MAAGPDQRDAVRRTAIRSPGGRCGARKIDWKFALGLPLDDPSFDPSVLCEFCARLLEGSAEQQLLDTLLTTCRDRGWLHARGRQLERYGRTWDDHRLPSNQVERDQVVAIVGEDGLKLLTGLFGDDAPVEHRGVSGLEILRQVWLQDYVATETGVRCRTTADGLPPATRFISWQPACVSRS